MLNKWIESDNPTLQVAAMRLLSDTDEHRRLNQSYIDHKHGADDETIKQLVFVARGNRSK